MNGQPGQRLRGIAAKAAPLSALGLLCAAVAIWAGPAQATVYLTIASHTEQVYVDGVTRWSSSSSLPASVSYGDGFAGAVSEALSGPPLAFAAAEYDAGSPHGTEAIANSSITYWFEQTAAKPGIFPVQFNVIQNGSGGALDGAYTTHVWGPIYSESGSLFSPYPRVGPNANLSGIVELYLNTAYTIEIAASATASCPTSSAGVCPGGSFAIAVDPSIGTVPEPGTWALFLTGMGFVGLVSRRRARCGRGYSNHTFG